MTTEHPEIAGLPVRQSPHSDQSSSSINLHRGNGISRPETDRPKSHSGQKRSPRRPTAQPQEPANCDLLGRLQSNRASELSNSRRTGLCYAWRMSPVATLAMLMLMLMPAAAASIPAVKSAQCPPGYIVSGGYCTPMFRPAPGLRGPLFPGNGISRPETKAPKLPR